MNKQQEESYKDSFSSSESCGQAEHTPGPWRLRDHTVMSSRGQDERDEIARTLPLTGWHTSSSERKANSRLIASAPDLLAACRAVLDCEMKTDENGNAYLKVPARSLSDLGAQIRALVEQAEGEE